MHEALTFEELSRTLMAAVIQADAAMQVAQDMAWKEASGGVVIVEGMDRLENLGLAEVRFTMALEPAQAFLPARLWAALAEPLGRGWFGRVKQSLKEGRGRYRLVSGGDGAKAVLLVITVGREEDGRWHVRSDRREPTKANTQPAPQEEADVARQGR